MPLIRVRVDLGAMAMKGYSTFPKSVGPASGGLMSYQRHTLREFLLLCRDAVSVFYCPN